MGVAGGEGDGVGGSWLAAVELDLAPGGGARGAAASRLDQLHAHAFSLELHLKIVVKRKF